MSGKVWYQLADGEGHTKLYPSLTEAKAGLERELQTHTSKGHQVRVEDVKATGEHPLWIVEEEGEIIAKYRLTD